MTGRFVVPHPDHHPGDIRAFARFLAGLAKSRAYQLPCRAATTVLLWMLAPAD
jgi:hypothetical protein